MRRLLCAAALAGCAWGVSAGDFRFDRYVSYPMGVARPAAVAIGDVTGDGKHDVVAVTDWSSSDTANNNRVFIYAQHPNGGLAAPVKYLLPQSVGDASIVIADLNEDGRLDIVVGHTRGLSLLIADGAANFTLSRVDVSCQCYDLGVLDIDLDGNLDIVGQSSGNATLFYGNGQGGIRSTATLNNGAASSGRADLKVGDVTGDGHPDLVIVSYGSAQFLVHPHNGVDGFAPVHAYPSSNPSEGLSAVAIGDFNGDGRNDVAATASTFPAVISLYLQSALGELQAPQSLATGYFPEALISVDLDRDGRKDLVTVHGGGQGLGYYLQGSTGMAAEVLTQVPSAPWYDSQGLASGDINSDGCPDIAIVDDSNGLTLLRGCQNRAATTDFNLDRKSDLMWHNAITGANVIWRSANNAIQQQVASIADTAWTIAGIGDFNGDQQSDVLWRNTSTGANGIWRSANSASPQAVTPVGDLTFKVVGLGDFDGDGHSDILWRNMSTGANGIWRSANSSTSQAVTSVTNMAWKVAGIGDFDGDGHSDILWYSNATGAGTIWKSANYAQAQNLTTVTNLDWKIAGVGDFTGDGKSDILWRNGRTGANAIWISGNAATQQPVTAVTNQAWQVTGTGDYNGDGKSDILWRNASSGANVIWNSANYATQQSVTDVTNQVWKIVP